MARLLSRHRGRKSAGSSGRSTVRGAGGGGSLMARSVRDRLLLLRRRPHVVLHGDDRISTLSDDLLLDILGRLDTRTALDAGRLSKRWAGLPRELPFFNFSVGDTLPPRYHRWVLLHRESESTDFGTDKAMPHIRRYERRAMRALTRSVERLLDAAADGVGRRVISRLALEFFSTNDNTSCINRLISRAIDDCEVHDLVAVAKGAYWQCRNFHAFPSQGICEGPRASRLRSLKLGGCVIPALHGHRHSALTVLVLQDTPVQTPDSAYEGIFTSCPQLQVLHLISCYSAGNGQFTVDAPGSDLRELVVDNCVGFVLITLRALPRLERLASLGTRVRFETASSFPRLTQCNLALCMGVREETTRRYFAHRMKFKPGFFLQGIPGVTDLIVRYTGPDRWIVPAPAASFPPPPLLPNLRRLLVADVPRSWDVSWPRLLLETAPSLQTLHIHIAQPCQEEDGDEISWQHPLRRHLYLKEFVMVGFEGTERQVYLVRFVMRMCTRALRHVAMFKNGRVRDKGHWDWEMVTQHQHSQSQWTQEEKDKMVKQIMNGVTSSSPASPIIVLG